MSYASQKQLRRLAAHDQLEDRDYTSEEASSMISSIVDSKSKPHWSKADSKRQLIWKIETRGLKNCLKKAQASRKSGGLSEDKSDELDYEIEEIESRLEEIAEEKQDWKDEKEDARVSREDEKYRHYEIQLMFGTDSEWSAYIKKPSLAQIKKCVEALDKEMPQWEVDPGEIQLVSTLMDNYPQLKKKGAPDIGQSKGCLVFLVIGIGILLTLGGYLVA